METEGSSEVFLFVAVFMLVLAAAQRLLQAWKVPDTQQQQAEMQQEIAYLKRQAALLNTPDTFSQAAKAERKAIALGKQLARLVEEQETARAHYLLTLPQTGRFLLLCFLLFRSTAAPLVASLPPQAAWPLGRWLAWSSGQPSGVGAVGLVPWALLCQRVAAALFRRRAS